MPQKVPTYDDAPYCMAVMGAAGVGKTALIMRAVTGQFVPRYDPTIEDDFRHDTILPNSRVSVGFAAVLSFIPARSDRRVDRGITFAGHGGQPRPRSCLAGVMDRSLPLLRARVLDHVASIDGIRMRPSTSNRCCARIPGCDVRTPIL